MRSNYRLPDIVCLSWWWYWLVLLMLLVRGSVDVCSKVGMVVTTPTPRCVIFSLPSFPWLNKKTQIGELVRLLRGDQGGLRMFESYPVVTGLDGMAFVGTVSRKDLVREEMERRDQRNVGRERHIAGGRREGGGETGLGTPPNRQCCCLFRRTASYPTGAAD